MKREREREKWKRDRKREQIKEISVATAENSYQWTESKRIKRTIPKDSMFCLKTSRVIGGMG